MPMLPEKEGLAEVMSEASVARHDKIRVELPRCLVRIARDYQELGRSPTRDGLSGGGVLVRTPDERQGILTAAHCLEPCTKDRTLRVLAASHRRRGAGWVEVVVNNDEAIRRHRNKEDCVVPDLAWIPLDGEKARLIERHGGVLHNLGAHSAARAAPGGLYGYYAMGWMADHERLMERTPYASLWLEKVSRAEGPDIKEADGWDHAHHIFETSGEFRGLEVAGSNLDGKVPEDMAKAIPEELSRAGYSGGALWRVAWMPGSTDYKAKLVGIIFCADYSKDGNGNRKFLCHREGSIRRILEQ